MEQVAAKASQMSRSVDDLKFSGIENTIKNARTIENLHELIKNNGKSFELSDEEMQLAELLG